MKYDICSVTQPSDEPNTGVHNIEIIFTVITATDAW